MPARVGHLFETRKPGIDYPCMTGDIEKVAGLTVCEPDDGMVHFASGDPSIRMPFPALRSWRQRARMMGQVGW
jgi:hypothetical protein